MSHVLKPALLMLVISILVACGSSPEKQKARAEAKYTEEKTKTMQEYKSKKLGRTRKKSPSVRGYSKPLRYSSRN